LALLTLCFHSCSSPIYRPIFNNSIDASKAGEVAVMGAMSLEGALGSIAYSPKDNFFIRSGYYSNFYDDKYKALNVGVGYNHPLLNDNLSKIDLYGGLDYIRIESDRYANNQNFEYQKLFGLSNESISLSTGAKFTNPLFSDKVLLVNRLGFRFANFNIKKIVVRDPDFKTALEELRKYDGKILVDLNYETDIKIKNFSIYSGINYGLYKKTNSYLYPLEIWIGVGYSISTMKLKKAS
jgi:hypothetical protein